MSIFRDRYGYTRFWVFVMMWVAILGTIIAAIFAAVVIGSRLNGSGACSQWGEQTGYKVKFRLIGFLDTGHCLAQTPSGKWVLNTQVRGIDP